MEKGVICRSLASLPMEVCVTHSGILCSSRLASLASEGTRMQAIVNCKVWTCRQDWHDSQMLPRMG
jgi:hypothetical protein